MTEPVTSHDLVRFCLSGDAVSAADAFEHLVAEKIAVRIDDRRYELAQEVLGVNEGFLTPPGDSDGFMQKKT